MKEAAAAVFDEITSFKRDNMLLKETGAGV
jgi:hypothetical protein